MNGLRLFDVQNESIEVPKYEEKESDENGVITFQIHLHPIQKFLYMINPLARKLSLTKK